MKIEETMPLDPLTHTTPEDLSVKAVIERSPPQIVTNADIDMKEALVLDAHLIKTFRACETKFNWFEMQHVVGKGSRAAPAFGIALHEGIAAFRIAKRDGKDFENAVKLGAAYLIKAYREHMPAENQAEVMQDDKRSLDNAIRIYIGYCHHYEPLGLKYLYIEVPFALYLGKVKSYELIKDISNGMETWIYNQDKEVMRDLVYVGIIDGVLESHEHVQVNDLKTTGWTMNEQWLEGFRMEQALPGYVIAAKELLGVDSNYASVHGIWVQREAKTNRGKPLDEYFRTKEIYWDQQQLEEWHFQLIKTAERIERSKAFNDWQADWGQNCGAFGGCPYRALCAAPPDGRQLLIENDYQKGIWAPLEDERLQLEDS